MSLEDLRHIFEGLEAVPALLRHLVEAAPEDRIAARRIPGKWTLQEHVCHLTSIHPVMFERLKRFQTETSPVIEPSAGLIPRDSIEAALDRFSADRAELLRIGRGLPPEILRREARHPEYDIYTPFHLFRHVLMHDHVHLYRIEELAFTRDEWLRDR